MITRIEKGNPLTHDELDQNFIECQNLKGIDIPSNDLGSDGDYYTLYEHPSAVDAYEFLVYPEYDVNNDLWLFTEGYDGYLDIGSTEYANDLEFFEVSEANPNQLTLSFIDNNEMIDQFITLYETEIQLTNEMLIGDTFILTFTDIFTSMINSVETGFGINIGLVEYYLLEQHKDYLKIMGVWEEFNNADLIKDPGTGLNIIQEEAIVEAVSIASAANIASETTYDDTLHNTSLINLQDTTDDYFENKLVEKVKGSPIVVPVNIGSFTTSDAYFGTDQFNFEQMFGFRADGLICHVGAGPSGATRGSIVSPTGTTVYNFSSGHGRDFDPFSDIGSQTYGVTPNETKAIDMVSGTVLKSLTQTQTYDSIRMLVNMSDNFYAIVEEEVSGTDQMSIRVTCYNWDDDSIYLPIFTFDTSYRENHYLSRYIVFDKGFLLGHKSKWAILKDKTLGWTTLDMSLISATIGSDVGFGHDLFNGKFYVGAYGSIDSDIYECTIDSDTGIVELIGESIFKRTLNSTSTLQIFDDKLLLNNLPQSKNTTYPVEILDIIPEFTEAFILHNEKDSVIDGELGAGSLSIGNNSKAIANNSIAVGEGCITDSDSQVSTGHYNDVAPDSSFVVGTGEHNTARNNGLVVYKSGQVLAPSSIKEEIVDSQALITLDYYENNIPDVAVDVQEAPVNGKTYGRSDANWKEIKANAGILEVLTDEVLPIEPVVLSDSPHNVIKSSTTNNIGMSLEVITESQHQAWVNIYNNETGSYERTINAYSSNQGLYGGPCAENYNDEYAFYCTSVSNSFRVFKIHYLTGVYEAFPLTSSFAGRQAYGGVATDQTNGVIYVLGQDGSGYYNIVKINAVTGDLITFRNQDLTQSSYMDLAFVNGKLIAMVKGSVLNILDVDTLMPIDTIPLPFSIGTHIDLMLCGWNSTGLLIKDTGRNIYEVDTEAKIVTLIYTYPVEFDYRAEVYCSVDGIVLSYNGDREKINLAVINYKKIFISKNQAGYLSDNAKDSISMGNRINISKEFGTAIGEFNEGLSSSLFEVGNGTGDEAENRSNALEVHDDGDVQAPNATMASDDSLITKGYFVANISTTADKVAYDDTLYSTGLTDLQETTDELFYNTILDKVTGSQRPVDPLLFDTLSPVSYPSHLLNMGTVSEDPDIRLWGVSNNTAAFIIRAYDVVNKVTYGDETLDTEGRNTIYGVSAHATDTDEFIILHEHGSSSTQLSYSVYNTTTHLLAPRVDLSIDRITIRPGMALITRDGQSIYYFDPSDTSKYFYKADFPSFANRKTVLYTSEGGNSFSGVGQSTLNPDIICFYSRGRGKFYIYDDSDDSLVEVPMSISVDAMDRVYFSYDKISDTFYAQSASQRKYITADGLDYGTDTFYDNLPSSDYQNSFISGGRPFEDGVVYGYQSPAAIYYSNVDPTNVKQGIASITNSDCTLIGDGAMDISDRGFDTEFGAKGYFSAVFGVETETTTRGGMVVGEKNLITDAKFVVGIGDAVNDIHKDAFIVTETGDVQAPNRLDTPTEKSLLTKDIADTLYGSILGEIEHNFDATDLQTDFPVVYELGKVTVYIEGVRVRATEFTADNLTSVILNNPVATDTWVLIVTR